MLPISCGVSSVYLKWKRDWKAGGSSLLKPVFLLPLQMGRVSPCNRGTSSFSGASVVLVQLSEEMQRAITIATKLPFGIQDSELISRSYSEESF